MDPMNEDSKEFEGVAVMFYYNESSSDSDSDSNSDDDDDSSDSDDLNVITNDMEDPKNNTISVPKDQYKVISQEDIRQTQERDIAKISDILSITRSEAALLLVHCNWSVNTIPDKWFTNGVQLLEEMGLSECCYVPVDSSYGTDVVCGICSLKFSPEYVASPPCGHMFCNNCWAGYIGTSVENGVDCLKLRCPNPSCRTAVDREMINLLASDADKELYALYFLRTYVDLNPKARWCPIQGCNHAVILGNLSMFSKVTCKCLYSFCWKCSQEAHEPISCLAANNWGTEGSKQSETTSDYMVTTSSSYCPNCQHSFEVDGRYKRVECISCKAQFCRLCFASYLDHGFWEGDQYTHICIEGKNKGIMIMDEDSHRAKKARYSLTSYEATVGQWNANDRHLQAALKEIQDLKNGNLEAVAYKQRQSLSELEFVTEAWLQIANCKRILKWLSVHLYYLQKDEEKQRFLVNFLQKRGEVILERLYQTASELTNFAAKEEPFTHFSQFRTRLRQITNVARNYYSNLVWTIDAGESDLTQLRWGLRSRMIALAQRDHAAAEGSKKPSEWTCTHCQFPNKDAALCVMCYQ